MLKYYIGREYIEEDDDEIRKDGNDTTIAIVHVFFTLSASKCPIYFGIG